MNRRYQAALYFLSLSSYWARISSAVFAWCHSWVCMLTDYVQLPASYCIELLCCVYRIWPYANEVKESKWHFWAGYRVHIYMMMIDETRLLHIDKGVMFKLVGSICLWQQFFSLFVRFPIWKVEEICGLQLYNEWWDVSKITNVARATCSSFFEKFETTIFEVSKNLRLNLQVDNVVIYNRANFEV
jgi:hypothetical protein